MYIVNRLKKQLKAGTRKKGKIPVGSPVRSNRYGKALTLRTVKRIRKGKPVVTVKELRKEFQLTPTGKKQFKPVRDTAAAGLRATRKIKKATKDINYSSAVPNHW